MTTAETMAEEEKKVRRRPAPRAPRASSSTLTRADPRSRPKMWRWGRPRAPRPDSKSRSGTPSACACRARTARARAACSRTSRARRENVARSRGPIARLRILLLVRPPMGNSQVELGYLRRHVRNLPQLAERAVHRVPSEPVAQQRKRPLDRVRLLRTCVALSPYRAPAVPSNICDAHRALSPPDVFHLDCIQRWLKTRSVCPLCNKEWEFAKIERIPGYGSLS